MKPKNDVETIKKQLKCSCCGNVNHKSRCFDTIRALMDYVKTLEKRIEMLDERYK